jgi:hypothetical protein
LQNRDDDRVGAAVEQHVVENILGAELLEQPATFVGLLDALERRFEMLPLSWRSTLGEVPYGQRLHGFAEIEHRTRIFGAD